jgi:SAM-dependent methyltransferase
MIEFLRKNKVLRWLWLHWPIGFTLRRPRPAWDGESDRISYQEKFNDLEISEGAVALDIGGGDHPFPKATILSDRYLESTEHRYLPIVRDGRPFVIFDVHNIPFSDKSIDFVYCSHVLEHVDDPHRTCSEIMRVGHQGYIETPSLSADMLFAWAKGMHKWHIVCINNILFFFEYTPRQLEGVRSMYWRKKVLGSVYHPLQDIYFNNIDLFNVMFRWSEKFECVVLRLQDQVANDRA